MTKKLIDPIKEIEKAKLAIPHLERILETGGFSYIAGSLILGFPDPTSKPNRDGKPTNFTSMNVRPLEDCGNSEILRKAQYLTSKCYVKYKGETCHFYEQALSNIEQYEKQEAASSLEQTV